MKAKTKQAVAQIVIGCFIFIVAVYAMVEMFFSTTFLAVYDAAGNWHLFPQLTRYLMYIELGATAAIAAYVAYCGGRFLLRKVKKLF